MLQPFSKLVKLHLQTPQALLALCPLLDLLLSMLIQLAVGASGSSSVPAREGQRRKGWHQRTEPHAGGLSTNPHPWKIKWQAALGPWPQHIPAPISNQTGEEFSPAIAEMGDNSPGKLRAVLGNQGWQVMQECSAGCPVSEGHLDLVCVF